MLFFRFFCCFISLHSYLLSITSSALFCFNVIFCPLFFFYSKSCGIDILKEFKVTWKKMEPHADGGDRLYGSSVSSLHVGKGAEMEYEIQVSSKYFPGFVRSCTRSHSFSVK